MGKFEQNDNMIACLVLHFFLLFAPHAAQLPDLSKAAPQLNKNQVRVVMHGIPIYSSFVPFEGDYMNLDSQIVTLVELANAGDWEEACNFAETGDPSKRIRYTYINLVSVGTVQTKARENGGEFATKMDNYYGLGYLDVGFEARSEQLLLNACKNSGFYKDTPLSDEWRKYAMVQIASIFLVSNLMLARSDDALFRCSQDAPKSDVLHGLLASLLPYLSSFEQAQTIE